MSSYREWLGMAWAQFAREHGLDPDLPLTTDEHNRFSGWIVQRAGQTRTTPDQVLAVAQMYLYNMTPEAARDMTARANILEPADRAGVIDQWIRAEIRAAAQQRLRERKS